MSVCKRVVVDEDKRKILIDDEPASKKKWYGQLVRRLLLPKLVGASTEVMRPLSRKWGEIDDVDILCIQTVSAKIGKRRGLREGQGRELPGSSCISAGNVSAV